MEEGISHPSFGAISIHHTSGGHEKLFMSNVAHAHKITISISPAKKMVDGVCLPWIFPDMGKLIEVELSPDQFAELITTPNTGSGVPCTIRRIGKESIPNVPEEEKTPMANVIEQGQLAVAEDQERFLAAVHEALVILDQPSITKADRKALRYALEGVQKRNESDFRFYKEQLVEAAEKVTSEIKASVESTWMSFVNRTGFEFLKTATKKDVQKLLSGGGNEDNHG